MLTHHAAVRSQQRCIPPMLIDLLLRFGVSEPAGKGAEKVFLDQRARKQLKSYAGPLAPLLERELDIYAVVAGEGQVITVAHRLF
ncbi:hypothetical protein [Pulveribacter sp.]|uniref:hypothetical protein n=1 Tax=Pulveribacter sp. TaxID=2678893 RepID=UPI0028ADF74E|nr:hypothetical protein [Pulveribacter sp.]